MRYAVVAGLVVLAGVVIVFRRLNSAHHCARYGLVKRLVALLDRRPVLLSARNRAGETPLHQAAKYGRIDTLRLCLDRGADVNAVTREGVTPLHFAAAFGAGPAVALLLEHGAAPDLHEKQGVTPFMAATVRGHDEVCQLLKAAGAQDFLVLPPLPIDDDDPFMLEARGRARDSTGTFLRLAAERPHDACVKVAFRTDTGNTEHIWCDWIKLVDSQMHVRIRTYPINQRKQIALEQTFPLSAIEDWQVEDPDGTVRGGYGFKVMFQYYRDKLGELPPELAEQEKRYVDL